MRIGFLCNWFKLDAVNPKSTQRKPKLPDWGIASVDWIWDDSLKILSEDHMGNLNLSDTPRKAFSRGFWSGLTAPSFLFSTLELPPVQEIKHVKAPEKTGKAALVGDWVAIGNDMRTVIDLHGKKNQ